MSTYFMLLRCIEGWRSNIFEEITFVTDVLEFYENVDKFVSNDVGHDPHVNHTEQANDLEQRKQTIFYIDFQIVMNENCTWNEG